MNNSNQPAFPNQETSDQLHPNFIKGLTKREYFAGLAMQGMLANSSCRLNDLLSDSAINAYVSDSIKLTDELLKQLENEK